MGVQYDRDRRKFVVRWREDGRKRTRRFETEQEAATFDATHSRSPVGRSPSHPPSPDRDAHDGLMTRGRGDGIYAYRTNDGIRWRFLFRQSDGTSSSRRGYASRGAAVAARRKLLEDIRRGEVKVSREDFATFWEHFLRDRRPYMRTGSYTDLAAHGRKRLLPFFGNDPLGRIDDERVREWMHAMVDLVEAGDLAPKTINNARTYLSMAFNEAIRRGLVARNPCTTVPALPVEQRELEYLRLHEIGLYLNACGETYRPLAEFLLGSGARVSEALAVRWRDLDFGEQAVRIQRQRDRTATGTSATKGKRFRSVQIGPGLCRVLAELPESRGAALTDWIFLCPTPSRGRYAKRTTQAPPHRKTVHEWHEAALEDAGLRDMPLHALRHTAAAAWLAAGNPLIFVQRQLGHRSITTTERFYGHLEASLVRRGAADTEALIARAGADGSPSCM